MIDEVNKEIRRVDKQIEALRQITGIGPITSLAFVLTLEEPSRFAKSREVDAFLGLTPKRDQSGESNELLSITKAGNAYLRRLLLGAANYILGPFGPDCELRRYGEWIASRGGMVAKRKAKVAVARKVAVLMHHLWKNHGTYDPFYHADARKQRRAA
jgi:transposase